MIQECSFQKCKWWDYGCRLSKKRYESCKEPITKNNQTKESNNMKTETTHCTTQEILDGADCPFPIEVIQIRWESIWYP